MSRTLAMPRLGETMEQGTVVAWLVEEGAAFARGDVLLEVETDKTVVEVPALGAGRLLSISVPAGEVASVGGALAIIEPKGNTDWLEDVAEEKPGEARDDRSAPPPPAGPARDDPAGTLARATPPARLAARRAGIDLSDLRGSGRRGRVELHDVNAYRDPSPDRAVRFHEGIAWQVEGPQDGPPIVMLHGFAADMSTWAVMATRLARDGARVLRVDLPGHGATRLEATDPDALSEGLADLLENQCAVAPHVVAHSLGAVPAVAVALAGHAGALTLVAPAGLGIAIDAEFVRGMATPASVGQIDHFLARLSDDANPLSVSALAALHAELSRGRLVRLAAAITSDHGQTVNLRDGLRTLAARMPVRIVVGHRDRILAWHEAQNVDPRIAVHHLPRAGHMPHWDDPAAVAAILGEASS